MSDKNKKQPFFNLDDADSISEDSEIIILNDFEKNLQKIGNQFLYSEQKTQFHKQNISQMHGIFDRNELQKRQINENNLKLQETIMNLNQSVTNQAKNEIQLIEDKENEIQKIRKVYLGVIQKQCSQIEDLLKDNLKLKLHNREIMQDNMTLLKNLSYKSDHEVIKFLQNQLKLVLSEKENNTMQKCYDLERTIELKNQEYEALEAKFTKITANRYKEAKPKENESSAQKSKQVVKISKRKEKQARIQKEGLTVDSILDYESSHRITRKKNNNTDLDSETEQSNTLTKQLDSNSKKQKIMPAYKDDDSELDEIEEELSSESEEDSEDEYKPQSEAVENSADKENSRNVAKQSNRNQQNKQQEKQQEKQQNKENPINKKKIIQNARKGRKKAPKNIENVENQDIAINSIENVLFDI